MKAKRDEQLFFQFSGIDNQDNYKNFEIIFSNFNLKFDPKKVRWDLKYGPNMIECNSFLISVFSIELQSGQHAFSR
jgi:hypothetical protein